jgi:hypothetical protein
MAENSSALFNNFNSTIIFESFVEILGNASEMFLERIGRKLLQKLDLMIGIAL